MLPQRFPLLQLPTPLHRLDRISDKFQAEIWIKRDDLTGFGEGGNKGRKLEYLVAAALESGADTVLSCGSSQSNFLRQLAVACSVAGLRCAAASMSLPYDKAAGKPNFPHLKAAGGNVLLGQMAGLDLRVFPDDDWEVLYDHQAKLEDEYRENGHKVYSIPIGGSSGVGAYGFYAAAQELADHQFDWIVHSSSSGSTQTGLAYAFRGTSTQVLGIAADPEPEIAHDFAQTGEQLAHLLEVPPLHASDYKLNFDFVGPGYGTWSQAGNEAIRELWQTEGILLDPIYSGKAFAALLSLLQAGKLSGRILFWHTGGIPSVFAAPDGTFTIHAPSN